MRLRASGLILTLALGFLVAPLCSNAQPPPKIPRIGLLSPFAPADAALWHEAFRQGLRDLGWVEGKNISIEYRYAEGSNERLPDLAADLVRLGVDLIVASVTPDALAAKQATRTIPIIMVAPGDPVGSGLVDSLARPGGNVTGLTNISPQMVGKGLELLKDMLPTLSRVAVLWNPQGSTSTLSWNELQLPALQLGVQLQSLEVRSANDLDKAFADATQAQAGALAITPDPVFVTHQKRIAALAAQKRLPAIFHLRTFVDVGGLMAYGPDRSDSFRRVALYVDKVLKGATPADLPVERPMKFELVINLKTAQDLGLTIPPAVLFQADEVIR